MEALTPPAPRPMQAHPVQDMRGRLIRLSETERITGLKKSTIYTLMRGDFPHPVRLSARAVAWRESEVLDWCASRVSVVRVGQA